MRSRNIRPSYFSNETLAEVSTEVRLLFIGLWCMADRAGRLDDRPKRIKAQIFPYDPFDVETLLSALAALHDDDRRPAFILRYEVAGKRYIQIVNFVKHQHFHCKEPASTIPAPDSHRTSTVPARLKSEIGNLKSEIGEPDSNESWPAFTPDGVPHGEEIDIPALEREIAEETANGMWPNG